MKPKELSELSLEELHKQKGLVKGALIGLGIVMISAYTTLIVLAVKGGNFAFIALVPTGFICLLPSVIRLNKLKAEIKNRQNQA